MTASWDTLLRQAPMTAADYFDEAYAYFKKRGIKPTDRLVIAFVEACVRDFETCAQAKLQQDAQIPNVDPTQI